MKKVLFFVLVLFVFTGCSSIYRGYEGLPLSEDQIAILEHPNALHSDFILEDVDGRFRGFGLIQRYELLPGEHSISCTFHHPLVEGGKITIYFKAQAHKTYVAKAAVGKRKWGMYIIDKETQEIVSYQKDKN